MASSPSPAVTSHDVDSPPREVWRTMTEPEPFRRWMGPGSTIQPVPGGPLTVSDPASGEPKVGRVTEVRPCEFMSWIWRPLGSEPDETTSVEVELVPIPDGTRITVTEAPSPVSLPLTPTMGTIVDSAPSCLGTALAGTALAGIGR